MYAASADSFGWAGTLAVRRDRCRFQRSNEYMNASLELPLYCALQALIVAVAGSSALFHEEGSTCLLPRSKEPVSSTRLYV